MKPPSRKRVEGAASFHVADEEYRKAINDMRDLGPERAANNCVAEYGVDVILGLGGGRINELSSAAGTYPTMAILSWPDIRSAYLEDVLTAGCIDFNGRPFGVAAVASANREALLVQLLSAWEKVYNNERKSQHGTSIDCMSGRL